MEVTTDKAKFALNDLGKPNAVKHVKGSNTKLIKNCMFKN